MKTLLFIFLILTTPLLAETFKSVLVDVDHRLTYPTNFFVANSNALNASISSAISGDYVGATNGLSVGLTATNSTLKGTISVPSGSALTIATGATFTANQLSITGTPSSSSDAANKTYVDQSDTVSRAYADAISTGIAADLTSLRALTVTTISARSGLVKSNTGLDKAAGFWIWDPDSTAAETTRIKKSSNLDGSSAGRWIKQ